MAYVQEPTKDIVSDRIGHAREGITVQIHGHRSTGHDREVAELVAGLIRLGSTSWTAMPGSPWSQIWSQDMENGPRDDLPRAVPVVAGVGFEPTTSGL
jgi:hypothetical protein